MAPGTWSARCGNGPGICRWLSWGSNYFFSTTVNVLPSPGELSTWTVPP
jgi:hypothetical protein